MATPLQFVVDVDEAGHLRARGLGNDMSIEADSLAGLEQSLVEAVFRRVGNHPPLRLVDARPRRAPWEGQAARRSPRGR